MNNKRAICRKCGMVLIDAESHGQPDFHHPAKSDCQHNSCYPSRKTYKIFYPKKYRRARKRGAKLASKFSG